MTKTYIVDGDAAFRINLPVAVTLTDFSTALGEHKYNLRGDFEFDKLTKQQAKKILFKRLEWHGRDGSYQGLEYLGEAQDEYNTYFSEAEEWVSKNYPYLTTKKDNP